MRIYLDYKSVYLVNGSKIDTSISASVGKHNLIVQAWDSTGAVYKSSMTVTVSGGTPTAPPATSAYDRYVSTSGSDSNDGTYGRPWRTFAKANSMAKPGYVIHVAPGTYTFYPTLKLTASGTSSARITWVSDTKGAAKIVSNGSTNVWDTGVAISGNYVDFKGFDVRGTNTSTLDNGVDLQGNYIRAIGNTVHDIVAPGPQGVGGCGICSSRQVVNNTINTGNQAIGNLVYNIGNPSNPTANPRVHGIYWASRNGYIANNIVHHSMSWGIQLGHAADRGTVVNNTVFSNGYGGIVINVSTSDNLGIRPDNMYVANNIVYNNGIGSNAQGYGIEEYNTSSNLGPNNLYVNNLVYLNKPGNWNLMVTRGSGTGTISTAPGFVNWQSSGSGDYRLSSSSPAINRGSGTKAPTTDFAGGARPTSGNWDIGAYEYGSAAASWSQYKP